MNDILGYFFTYGTYAIYALLLFLVLKFIITKTLHSHHSRWNTLIQNFNFSTQEFYKLLKEDLERKGIKRIKIEQVGLREGNNFSAKRSYLRATWKEYQYDICAAPFGKEGFFISWWLLYKSSIGELLVAKIPFVGGWLVNKLYPVTYYKRDTASMFMSYAQASVLKVIKDITENNAVRAIPENDQKPILNDIFKR